MAEHCPTCKLTAQDRADMLAELELAAEHYEAYVAYCADSKRDPAYAAPERERAERVRQLMALLAG